MVGEDKIPKKTSEVPTTSPAEVPTETFVCDVFNLTSFLPSCSPNDKLEQDITVNEETSGKKSRKKQGNSRETIEEKSRERSRNKQGNEQGTSKEPSKETSKVIQL